MRPTRLTLSLTALTFLSASALLFTSVAAHAQANSLWLSVDYTYSDVSYTNSALAEKARLGGIRGDFGLALTSSLGLEVAGDYQDGNFSADGNTLTGATTSGLTKDYLRDTRALADLFFGSFTIGAGVAQREWYDVLPGAYRQRTTYNYFPIVLTINEGGFYLKGEYDYWGSGTNKNYMSDLGATRQDTSLTQKSGSGWGAEIGYQLRSPALIETRIFASYHRWDVGTSDMQSDGVQALTQPKNNTVTIQGGIGINF